MSLAIRITWPERRYDAATTDPAVPEWPPAPARVVAALRASARTAAEVDALRWLEAQPAPRVLAEREPLAQRRETAYVVVNAIEKGGGNLTHPGRTNNVRTRVGSALREGAATLLWPAADTPPDIVEVLRRLAADVPYLGRTTSAAVLDVTTEPLAADVPAFVPTGLVRSEIDLPVPYSGFIDELEDLHAAGGRAHEAYRDMRAYRYDDGRPEPKTNGSKVAAPAAYPDVLTFYLKPGVHLAGELTGVLTTALRRAALDVMDDPLPPVLSGHDADGRPHVGFLAFPHVGNEYADGHVLALVLAVPAGAFAELETRLRTLAKQLRKLRVPGIGVLEVTRRPPPHTPFGASASRWAGPDRVWASATPVVLDRYPRRGLEAEAVVADGVVAAGFPRPLNVEVSPAPFVAGGLRLRGHQIPRRDGDRRPYRHVRLTFPEPVIGPVLVGALRHLGLGLCTPVSTAARGNEAR